MIGVAFVPVHFPFLKCSISSDHVEVKRIKVVQDQFLISSDDICNKVITHPRCRSTLVEVKERENNNHLYLTRFSEWGWRLLAVRDIYG